MTFRLVHENLFSQSLGENEMGTKMDYFDTIWGKTSAIDANQYKKKAWLKLSEIRQIVHISHKLVTYKPPPPLPEH